MSTQQLIDIEQRIRAIDVACREIDDKVDARFQETSDKKTKKWYESAETWMDRSDKLDRECQVYVNNLAARKTELLNEQAQLKAQRQRLNNSQFGGLDSTPL